MCARVQKKFLPDLGTLVFNQRTILTAEFPVKRDILSCNRILNHRLSSFTRVSRIRDDKIHWCDCFCYVTDSVADGLLVKFSSGSGTVTDFFRLFQVLPAKKVIDWTKTLVDVDGTPDRSREHSVSCVVGCSVISRSLLCKSSQRQESYLASIDDFFLYGDVKTYAT